MNLTDMNVDVLNWGPCVAKLKIDDKFHSKLLSEAKASRKKENLFQKQLAGIIKKEYAFRNPNIFIPEISRYLQLYDQTKRHWSNVLVHRHAKPSKYSLQSLWVNYQGPNEFNPPHDHSDTLSFIIYLDVPKKLKEEQKKYVGSSAGPGGISFLYGEGDRQSITQFSVLPETKDMWIFPSWLKHYVYPFTSKVERVSVSGNITDNVSLHALQQGATIHEYKKNKI
jgi:hypothetical protein